MLILAVDTSGKNGSLALVRFEGEAQKTLAIVPLEGGTFSAQLVPQIATLLERQHLSTRDIDAFAVVSGPGSFTGLRVGLAAIKALAEILQKPIVAVSLLEAVALASSVEGIVIAALEAGRREIYAGTFEIAGGWATCISHELKGEEEFSAGAVDRMVVTPDQRLAEVFRQANLKAVLIDPPRADSIARLSWDKIQRGKVVTAEALDATYIRRSDAEINLGK